MRGDEIEIQPGMDSLTRYIRDRIRMSLFQTPSIHSLWQLPALSRQHARQLADLSCGEFNQIQYYVGVDIQHSPLNGAVEISMRALDVGEKSWVSGFHQSWRGQLSPTQCRELNRRYKNESLRGLRALPFTVDQPDLLAAYIAHNFGCSLRYHPTTEEMVLYIPSPDGNETLPYFRTVQALVSNYLGRFREVQLTDDSAQATVLLESNIYSLHGDLHQVWVILRHAQNRRVFTGTETEAYVYLTPTSTGRKEMPAQYPNAKATRLTAPPQPQLYGSLHHTDPSSLETLPPVSSSSTSSSEELLEALRLSSIPNRAECVPKSRRFGGRWAGFLGKTTADPHQVRFLELDRGLGQSWVYAIAIAEQTVDIILDEQLDLRP